MENQEQTNIEVPAPGSEVEMIKVESPSFFERHFIHLLVVFAIGFLSFIFVFEIYLTPMYIVGKSMQPGINAAATSATDKTHTDLIYYRPVNNYTNNDIVVVNSVNYLASDEVSSIIKRVIAKPGDTITFDLEEGTTYHSATYIRIPYEIKLNGSTLTESYLNEENCYLYCSVTLAGEYDDSEDYTFLKALYNSVKKVIPVGSTYTNAGEYSYTLAEDEYFICGDNRNNSTDSRYFGPVKKQDIMGKVKIHVPYGSNLFVGIWKSIFSAKNIMYCE